MVKKITSVLFLWNFFLLREASTAERRYRKERWSENYMHMGAFSTRTHLLLPLSSSPPLSALHFLSLTPPHPPRWGMDSFWQLRQKSGLGLIWVCVCMVAVFGQQQ
jgi:hypothetical protein